MENEIGFSQRDGHKGSPVAVIGRLVVLLLSVPVFIAQGQETNLQPAALEIFPIQPSATDSAIKTFDFPHYLYVNRDIVIEHKQELPAERHQLLVFIPGTGGRGKSTFKFLELAANLGYHAVFLTYPSDVSVAQACKDDAEPSAQEEFRMSLIVGGKSKHIDIAPADSIENRLVKLVRYLKTARPEENWGQFLDADGGLKWSAIALSGQSQGGGHAALMAIKHRVARVISTGAPKDLNQVLREPAAWYRLESATPKGCFFAFNHDQDRQGNCSVEQQLENLRALQLDQFGSPANVDTEKPPYHHTRILQTDYPGGKLDSKTAHTSVINPANAAVFKDVWTYMLTEPVP